VIKTFVDLTRFVAKATHTELEARLRQLEDLGVTGISIWDHLFVAATSQTDDWRDGEVYIHPAEPLTGLALVAGINPRLEVHTAVVNSEWIHPALVLRQFAQIGATIGGSRVTAGLGMGWNNEEFDALGLTKPKFADRSLRLRDAMRVARQLYDTGCADFEGDYFSVRRLPLIPTPDASPRLLIAGASEVVCETAGKYADVLNLYGHPKYGLQHGKTSAQLHSVDTYRRINMKVEDAVERMQLAESYAQEVGRGGHLTASVHVMYSLYGRSSETDELERRICRDYAHVDHQDLADNPYILKGEPRQIADALQERQERFQLSELIFRPDDSLDVPGAESDPIRFCEEVLPLL